MLDVNSVGHCDPDRDRRLAVVWGNCQAAPLAELLDRPLAAAGLDVVRIPPVFEIDEPTLQVLRRDVLPRAGLLVSQPVRDEYATPGCGTRQLAELLPAHGRLLTFPVVYDGSAFPFQVRGYRSDGNRIAAPLTDYHDLRALVAAERQLSVAEAMRWWPSPTPAMVQAVAAESIAELRRRERQLDVAASDLLTVPRPAMHTLDHPNNRTLAAVAGRVLAVLGIADEATLPNPEREFLAAIRTPVEPDVGAALGYPPDTCTTSWVIDKQVVPLDELLDQWLSFYARHPDVVADARSRFADRLRLLHL